MKFEWDTHKAEANLVKHAISFEEASTVFGDPLSLTISDPDHSDDEQCSILLGQSYASRLLVVIHTEREAGIRSIGARLATRRERLSSEEK